MTLNILRKLIKSKLFKNTTWLMALQIFNTIAPMITLPYITRVLGTQAYGQFSTALNWIGYFQVIVEFGFGLTGTRKVAMAKDKNAISKIYSNIILARIILAFATLILMLVIAIITKIPVSMLICLFLLYIMIIGAVFQQTWLFQGMQEMRQITIVNIISRSISVILTFFMVRTADDLYMYCVLYSINYLLTGLIGVAIVHKKYKIKFVFNGIRAVKDEIKDAWYLFTSSAMTKIFSGFGVTVLSIISTDSEVGIYSAILKIPTLCILCYSPISQSLYPYISKKIAENHSKEYKKVKIIALPIIALFTVGAIIIIIVRKSLISMLFGAEYATHSELIIPLSIWMVLSIINNLLGIQILVASGHSKEYSKAFQIGVAAMIILNIIFGKIWHTLGIAVAAMISEAVLTMALVYNIKKYIYY